MMETCRNQSGNCGLSACRMTEMVTIWHIIINTQ